MSSGQLFRCRECDRGFTLYKNLIRHMNRVHGSLKRQDNEAKNIGLLKCTRLGTFKEPGVGCDPQVAFKSLKEYVSLAMQAHKDKELTSHEFMQVTELSVFKRITDTFWTLLYERPGLYVYVSEEMVN